MPIYHPPGRRRRFSLPRGNRPSWSAQDDITLLWLARAAWVYVESQRHVMDEGAVLEAAVRLGRLRVLPRGNHPRRASSLLRCLAARVAELEKSPPAREGPLFDNVRVLAEQVGLSPVDQDVLLLALLLSQREELRDLLDHAGMPSRAALYEWVARVLGHDHAAVTASLGANGPLRASGLLVGMDRDQAFALMEGLDQALQTDHATPDDLMKLFFRVEPGTSLVEDDFAHLAEDVRLLKDILSSAIREHARGINILVHGPPGTGKTEMVRLLARLVDGNLFSIRGQEEEATFLGRFGTFQVSQRILRKRERALILFDEAEDVFPEGIHVPFGPVVEGPGKGHVNRLLEENPVPTVWVSNKVQQMDRAYLRRFSCVVDVRVPPPAVRRRMLDAHLKDEPVSADWKARLSLDERLTPAHMGRAARVARLVPTTDAASRERTIGRILEGGLAVSEGPPRPARSDALGPAYDLKFLNVSHDIRSLADALAARCKGKVCLYGPPGTGKTAFASHVAERAGRQLLVRTASDLLGSFLGETERNLAEMFREATSSGAVLLLDEGDSFLRERGLAYRSWEVTQVNELLVQMERFEGLFFCATNLVDALDQASLRRFALKMRFDFLRPDQRVELFTRMLGLAGTSASTVDALSRLNNLAPGDYAAARAQAEMFGSPLTEASLLRALVEESRAKKLTGGPSIGFRPEAVARA